MNTDLLYAAIVDTEQVSSYFESLAVCVQKEKDHDSPFYRDASKLAILCARTIMAMYTGSKTDESAKQALRVIAGKWPEKVEEAFDLAEKQAEDYSTREGGKALSVLVAIAQTIPRDNSVERRTLDKLSSALSKNKAAHTLERCLSGFLGLVQAKPRLARQVYSRLKKIITNDKCSVFDGSFISRAESTAHSFPLLQACLAADNSLAPFLLEMAKPLFGTGKDLAYEPVRDMLLSFVKADDRLCNEVLALAPTVFKDMPSKGERIPSQGFREELAQFLADTHGIARGPWTSSSLATTVQRLNP